MPLSEWCEVTLTLISGQHVSKGEEIRWQVMQHLSYILPIKLSSLSLGKCYFSKPERGTQRPAFLQLDHSPAAESCSFPIFFQTQFQLPLKKAPQLNMMQSNLCVIYLLSIRDFNQRKIWEKQHDVSWQILMKTHVLKLGQRECLDLDLRKWSDYIQL